MFSQTRRTRLIASTGLALALLTGAACSSSSDSDADEASTTTVAEGDTATPGSGGAGDGTGTDDTRPPVPDDVTEQDYADALTAGLPVDEDGPGFSAEQTVCIGEGFASAIGIDAFRSAGVAPEVVAQDPNAFGELGIDAATAEAMAVAVEDCGVDYKSLLLATFEGSDQSPEQIDCVDKELTPDVVHDLIVASFLNVDIEAEFPDLVACQQ